MSNLEVIKPLFLPRGVAEPNGKIGYLANATNGIDAIDLSNGKTLWTSSEAYYPLLATNNWLAAQKIIPEQSNAFQIVKLDTKKKGDVLLVSEPIIFPDWVVISSPNKKDFSFTVNYSKPFIHLSWQAKSHYRGGANPPSYVLQKSAKESKGHIHIDMESGKIKILPFTNQESLENSKISLEEQFGSGWWIAGQNLSVLVWEESQGEQVLQLKTRQRISKQMVEHVVELARGKALVSTVTPDGRYILVHLDASEQLITKFSPPWWIFSAETGHLITKLKYEEGTKTASILNSKIYYLVEETASTSQCTKLIQSVLKSKDLRTGQFLWEHLLQEESTQKVPPLPQ